jgi:23S rRNA pseudouridine2605 synthase
VIDQPENLLRLNRAIAGSGLCSRRKADVLISQGKVAVNGQTVRELGLRIDPAADRVAVEGKILDIPLPGPGAGVTVALHKPVRVVSTASDPQGRQTVVDLLPQDLKRLRLVPVGRLDFFSEGLLLLSNAGELIHRLTHPRWHVTKTYQVLISGKIPPGALETMGRGMTLQEGDKLAPVRASVLKSAHGGTWLEMELHQGVNRQIRRMCRDLDLTILRLIRTRQGPISLGSLAPGRIRRLNQQELVELRSLVGLETDPQSGTAAGRCGWLEAP